MRPLWTECRGPNVTHFKDRGHVRGGARLNAVDEVELSRVAIIDEISRNALTNLHDLVRFLESAVFKRVLKHWKKSTCVFLRNNVMNL